MESTINQYRKLSADIIKLAINAFKDLYGKKGEEYETDQIWDFLNGKSEMSHIWFGWADFPFISQKTKKEFYNLLKRRNQCY